MLGCSRHDIHSTRNSCSKNGIETLKTPIEDRIIYHLYKSYLPATARTKFDPIIAFKAFSNVDERKKEYARYNSY